MPSRLAAPILGGVSRTEALAHAADLIAATDLPVSGDFENGFGDSPDEVAETVRLSGEVGLSGHLGRRYQDDPRQCPLCL